MNEFDKARVVIIDSYLRRCSSEKVLMRLRRCFKDTRTHYAWLTAPNLLLRGKTPLDVMYIERRGPERVLDIIEAQISGSE